MEAYRKTKIKEQNIEGMKNGFENLDKHVENGNASRPGSDRDFQRGTHPIRTREIALVAEHCREIGVGFCMNNVFAAGGGRRCRTRGNWWSTQSKRNLPPR
ncbi:MAG: hypothetical protein ACLR6J_15235 [Parabacteroides merdae]